MNLAELKFLLQKYHLSPNKIRGQNFLISDKVLSQIIEAADLSEEDLVVEIGAGLGALTAELVKYAGQVVSFEVDRSFRLPLEKMAQANANLKIYWQDILTVGAKQLEEILAGNKNQRRSYKVVANIPYYLTGKLIPFFLNSQFPPQNLTLMVQKEVAQRIMQKNNKHSMLSLAVALSASCCLVAYVSADNFFPAPQVDSAVVHISDIKKTADTKLEQKIWRLIHHGFANKRKKLINNLSADKDFDKEKIQRVWTELALDPNVRAEDLSVQQWTKLAKKI